MSQSGLNPDWWAFTLEVNQAECGLKADKSSFVNRAFETRLFVRILQRGCPSFKE